MVCLKPCDKADNEGVLVTISDFFLSLVRNIEIFRCLSCVFTVISNCGSDFTVHIVCGFLECLIVHF